MTARPAYSLNFAQRDRLAKIAQPLDPEKRRLFLERLAAILKQHGNPRPSDRDLELLATTALQGLVQQKASPARS